MIARRRTLVALAGTGLPALAHAQPRPYPNGPVRMIVPFGPGGASDIVARLLQPTLSAELGYPVVVENRAGAAGVIGTEVVARAAPDGHTVLLGNIGTISINPAIFHDMPVNPMRDLAPVTLIAETPGILVLHPAFPPNSVRALIEYIQARPGEVNFASPGGGTQNRLEMEVFAARHGLVMVHVPYRGGAGPAASDVVAGHIQLMFVTLSAALGHVQSGRLKALAVTTRERFPGLPDVPTMLEQGFPESVSASWQGLLVPAATPAPIIQRLHVAALATVADATVRRRMADAGAVPVTSETPAAFATHIAAETTRWRRVVQDTGARPD